MDNCELSKVSMFNVFKLSIKFFLFEEYSSKIEDS
uniref:Uncharacterized protein n=1 Tax=viral metagenome TaxID=1070528 RepID=A0A6C0AYR6_9ZZZZ